MHKSFTQPTRITAVLAGLGLAASAAFSSIAQADDADLLAAAEKEGKVIIYSTTDTSAADPVLKGFNSKYPNIQVEYHDMNSTEIYNRFVSEQASGANSADMVWSSAMDSTMQLATQYASKYASPEIPALPDWAVWEDKAYGTTFEPVAFIYNTRLLTDEELPRTHAALGELVAGDVERFKNKVTTYDIEKSAVGYMLAVQDSIQDKDYYTFLQQVGAGNLVLQSSTGTMMERVSSGENILGYNILGSYAEVRAEKDPSIGIIYPEDYTLVLSRVAFISEKAQNPNAARVFLNYLLSKDGQDILANQSNLTSIRADVEGDNDAKGMEEKLGDAIRPIAVNDDLLSYLKQKERLEFINKWRAAADK
ncbi:MAG TPA: ABC transporter substrate-binding protein [Paenalcaligenes sp.]|nr:ABC transporter substrate-binding protein [Paenalcaligenes sp.]